MVKRSGFREIIEEEQEKYLSVVSLWEISLLLKKNRLSIKYPFKDWILDSIKAHSIEIINLDLEIVLVYDNLHNFHSDPADKLIASTSISKKIPLLTFDNKLINYHDIEIIKL